MDLKSLTSLVEIIDAGNLSDAAQRLKVSRAVDADAELTHVPIDPPQIGPI
ncbi:hypothetical protein [Pseudomonas veronii]|uniref:hypothetical protein n=1 Tax=Pseudomonas veronii TaxID=76761 RepID=UPI0021BFE487|nr:hypothetical protein [Pseudomonas veronii]MCT9826652.1 hypothetical protein [Pseudomonas veronii]